VLVEPRSRACGEVPIAGRSIAGDPFFAMLVIGSYNEFSIGLGIAASQFNRESREYSSSAEGFGDYIRLMWEKQQAGQP
jgi:hypothetical protein